MPLSLFTHHDLFFWLLISVIFFFTRYWTLGRLHEETVIQISCSFYLEIVLQQKVRGVCSLTGDPERGALTPVL